MSDEQPQSEPMGEAILYRGRLHWTIYVRPVMLSCLALFLFNYGELVLSLISGLAAVLFWGAALLAARSTGLLITDQRVRLSSGTIYRVQVELPLAAIDQISMNQDFMGRMLGYGTLVVTSREGTRANCPNLAEPAEFYRELEQVAG
jgi:uncharacterized membrane protein YdbT with pleckstrin-like domain